MKLGDSGYLVYLKEMDKTFVESGNYLRIADEYYLRVTDEAANTFNRLFKKSCIYPYISDNQYNNTIKVYYDKLGFMWIKRDNNILSEYFMELTIFRNEKIDKILADGFCE